MLRLAAEEGYDYVAWTTGEQQAERYNLGTVVKKVFAGIDQEGNRHLLIYPNFGGTITITHDQNGDILDIVNSNGVFDSAKNISDIVGKDIAVQALSINEPGSANGKEFKSENLRVGAEGMKGFYDDILPRFMNKYGKKWGVKVSDITLPNVEKSGEIMHSVPVTPEMKESVMQGQTMFREARTAATAQIGYEDEMTSHCVGSLPELFDGNPPFKGRGAVSFAMNVAEILRTIKMINEFE